MKEKKIIGGLNHQSDKVPSFTFLDSRTPEEREADSKIKTTTTVAYPNQSKECCNKCYVSIENSTARGMDSCSYLNCDCHQSKEINKLLTWTGIWFGIWGLAVWVIFPILIFKLIT